MGSIKTFKYSELSEDAKEKVRYDDQVNSGYAWADEAIESIRALAVHFDGKMKNYGIDFFDNSYSFADFDMPELEPEEIKAKLDELGSYDPETLRGHGDCKLTGYCADENAIDGFRKAFVGGETDLEVLMQAAFETWLKDCQTDAKYQYSEEGYEESADMNDWEYFADGTFVSKKLRAGS